jgi:hypothetical protein
VHRGHLHERDWRWVGRRRRWWRLWWGYGGFWWWNRQHVVQPGEPERHLPGIADLPCRGVLRADSGLQRNMLWRWSELRERLVLLQPLWRELLFDWGHLLQRRRRQSLVRDHLHDELGLFGFNDLLRVASEWDGRVQAGFGDVALQMLDDGAVCGIHGAPSVRPVLQYGGRSAGRRRSIRLQAGRRRAR